MRAEYEEGPAPGERDAEIRIWHMVRLDGTTAMCGRELSPGAATKPADAWGTPEAEPFCHSCGALYLREVP
ncbi:hypothetical protein GCM10009801_04290 [Streptomyces albiaxialis]|uniref:Uncharacterized protein n=1 Tax=Streptomyces albiaxialis TaxID=329523 RepID=A0ABN2VGC6_9ACTN